MPTSQKNIDLLQRSFMLDFCMSRSAMGLSASSRYHDMLDAFDVQAEALRALCRLNSLAGFSPEDKFSGRYLFELCMGSALMGFSRPSYIFYFIMRYAFKFSYFHFIEVLLLDSCYLLHGEYRILFT